MNEPCNPRFITAGGLWTAAVVSCITIHNHLDVERFLYAAAITYTICLVIHVAADKIAAAIREYVDHRTRYLLMVLNEHRDFGADP